MPQAKLDSSSSMGYRTDFGARDIQVNWKKIDLAWILKRKQSEHFRLAEAENNRMMFSISGFGEDMEDPVEKVTVEHKVNSIGSIRLGIDVKNLRRKTASPDKIAVYLAKYINEVAEKATPQFTHGDT